MNPLKNKNVKILVISMPEATKRRKKLSKILENIQFEFVDGVDGKKLDIKSEPLYLRKKRLLFFGRDLMGTEIGCFMAHCNALKKGVAENAKHILILEDDVNLEDNFFEVLDEILESKFKFELIRFLGYPKTIKRGCKPVFKLSNYTIGRIKTTPGGGYAYLFSLEGAKKILKYIENKGTYLPIDTLLGLQWDTKIDGYAILSGLATSCPETHNSYIGKDRFNKQDCDKKPLYFPVSRCYFKLYSSLRRNLLYLFRLLKDRKI